MLEGNPNRKVYVYVVFSCLGIPLKKSLSVINLDTTVFGGAGLKSLHVRIFKIASLSGQKGKGTLNKSNNKNTSKTPSKKGWKESGNFSSFSKDCREILKFPQNLVNLFLTNLVRISGFFSLFLAIAVLSAHFPREC